MLHFVLQGHGAVRGPDGGPHPVAPGWLVVVPQGAMHALESDGEIQHERRIDAPPASLVAGSSQAPNLIVACGLVLVRYGEALNLFEHLQDMVAVDLSDSPQVRTAFESILVEESRRRPGSEAMKEALMSQCLVDLLRHLCSDPDCPLPWLTVLENPRLAQAVDRVLEDPGAYHTVDSLAAVFGLPPMRLVHHISMQSAARLLRQHDELSIDAVAKRVGFSSRSHFSRAFKKHYGVSPIVHRRG